MKLDIVQWSSICYQYVNECEKSSRADWTAYTKYVPMQWSWPRSQFLFGHLITESACKWVVSRFKARGVVCLESENWEVPLSQTLLNYWNDIHGLWQLSKWSIFQRIHLFTIVLISEKIFAFDMYTRISFSPNPNLFILDHAFILLILHLCKTQSHHPSFDFYFRNLDDPKNL